MKKLLLVACMLMLWIPEADARRSIVALDVIVRADGIPQYIMLLSDGQTYWYVPSRGWAKSSLKGIPRGKKIKLISGYNMQGQGPRYVAVLNDGSLYWYAPSKGWFKSSRKGLPQGAKIKIIKAYSKKGQTQYTAVLSNNRVYWYVPGRGWSPSSTKGFPRL